MSLTERTPGTPIPRAGAGEVDIAEFAPKSVKSGGDFEDILAAENRDAQAQRQNRQGARHKVPSPLTVFCLLSPVS